MKRRILFGSVAALAGAFLLLGAADQADRGIPDRSLGLSQTGVFEVPDPPAVVDNTSDPGERPPAARAYPDAPPVIPHGIADFLPITRDGNLCLGCHLTEEKVEGEPTPVPASHFTDLRNAPEERQADVVGARQVCVSCHVPRTEAAPLVGNGF